MSKKEKLAIGISVVKRNAITFALLLAPSSIFACTVCDSETGQQVRAGIFTNDFWSTLLAITAPFPVLLAAVAAVQYGLFRPRRPLS